MAARNQALRAQVVALWAEGKTYRELEVLLGRSMGSVASLVQQFRAEGLDLPYRDSEEARANRRAGQLAAWKRRRALVR